MIQPSLKDLAMDIDDVEYRIRRLRTQIKTATQTSMRAKFEDELRNFQNHLDVLCKLKGTNDCQTRQNLKVGKIVTHECCPIEYKGRKCLSDWGIFHIKPERRPGPTEFNSRPPTGVLVTREWNSVKQFGNLQWDQWVRKTGHVTGLTFGFVAGVHAGWNPGLPNCPPLTEFFVLEEKARQDNRFAAKGDSGSAVITTDSDFVGVVFATVDVT